MEKETRLKTTATDKVLEYAKAIGTALILALIIRTFVIQAFKIPSGSMIPTLLIGDHLLVNKIIYGSPVDIPFTSVNIFHMPGLRLPKKGEIVVFKYPEDPTRDFIKRVVATEGDTVQMIDKKLFVNGKPVEEPYVQHTDATVRLGQLEPRDNFGPYLVPKDKLFMMGDNRDQSYDSRFWGYVDVKQVLGKAMIIYWSWDSEKHMPRFDRMGKLIH
ncbi:MAG TPA: signal peptidase I [Dissulfurispiraceae bacterium]|nr:signal peptidase I [Dissulfurispiraceae bacterium]